MKKEDIAFPSFREQGVYLTRGAKPEGIFLYHKGDERGAVSKEVNVFMPSIPVGSQILHAAGAGMAFEYQNKKSAAIGYFGDGSTSKGDFHEALNFAGVFNAHTVFLCQNNQFAISLPVKEQTKAETIAQKAIAYGIDGIRVDGNDILAVYKATKDALENAYKGKPTLIECLTYRLGDHTTSDDAKKYRDENDVKKHEKFEPIYRFKKYLLKNKILTEAEDKKIQNKIKKQIKTGVKNFEEVKPYPPEDIIKYLYEKLPEELMPQLQEIKNLERRK
jgi:pyruvate dehydrogenase E1 component alpha subunit